MHKRKHEKISQSDPQDITISKDVRLQQQRLEGILDQGKRSAFQALKVARGSERQKLGRRQKVAKAENNNAETARLDGEVAALKNLDLSVTAKMHIYKSVLKIKRIALAPSFPKNVLSTVEKATKPDIPSANVQARLFNSAPVQTATSETLGNLRRVLGIEDVPSKRKRLRAQDFANEPKTGMKIDSRGSKNSSRVDSPIGEIKDRLSSEDSEETDRGSSVDLEDTAYRLDVSRPLVFSGAESISGDSTGEGLHSEELDPDQITQSDSDTDIEEKRSRIKPRTDKTASSSTAIKSTTFLPSLSMGGYWSGSEEAEELSDAGPQARKNRMGQQARRALWEKKFGKNANHVKAKPLNRDDGWDARRGASNVDDRGRSGPGRGGFRRDRGKNNGTGQDQVISGANSLQLAARKAKAKSSADGSLHPSWEAARKAKEQKSTISFQGKKVVFD